MDTTITAAPAGKLARNGSVILTDRLCQKRARLLGIADDRGLHEASRPAFRFIAINHRAIDGAVGGDDRRTRDPDLLLQRRRHSAAT